MKKVMLLLFMLSFTWLSIAQVGLNTITPDASSALDIESTTGGILVLAVRDGGKHGLVVSMQDQGISTWYEANDLVSNQDNHDVNGAKFMDWRLPTRRELDLMFAQRINIGATITNTLTSLYWSSTEFNWQTAWYQLFFDGSQAISYNKPDLMSVRAVRSF